MYINVDAILLSETQQEVPFQMTVFDKIYGQQSFVVASQLVPVSSQLQPYLSCLSEFRQTYVHHLLNRIFRRDIILHAQLDLLKTKRNLSKLASDVEIHCSLSYSLPQAISQ